MCKRLVPLRSVPSHVPNGTKEHALLQVLMQLTACEGVRTRRVNITNTLEGGETLTLYIPF
ncbi:hypothetical protein DVH24_018688 [Malus domestica]|uniref:Uncharacterized protein n=1 Tax=Malus domestica TaxID=3750 RepID=A0A498HR57_MALDO|nr:hypothetical protein DVH24_018688 [Malus domestica]